MPKSDSQKPSTDDMRKLLETMYPDIHTAVRHACGKLGHHFDEDHYNSYAHRVVDFLMLDDYSLLRSFKNESSPQTWLYKIAWRKILHWLEEENRQVSIDDMLPDAFISPPEQEEALLLKERKALVQAARRQLSERRELLYRLICEGLSAKEIAEKMKIKGGSVYPMRDVLIEKIQEIIDERGKAAKPETGSEGD
jgi:RNA polymerase sigma factor (sigma-70 family)